MPLVPLYTMEVLAGEDLGSGSSRYLSIVSSSYRHSQLRCAELEGRTAPTAPEFPPNISPAERERPYGSPGRKTRLREYRSPRLYSRKSGASLIRTREPIFP